MGGRSGASRSSTLVKTLARPRQLPYRLTGAPPTFEPLCIDGVSLIAWNFNDCDGASHASPKAVHNHFLDGQRKDAENALDVFTERIASDRRLDHRNHSITKCVIDIREVPTFHANLPVLLDNIE